MIKVENLTKIFGAKRAVDGVSFSLERGEVLGFLGPNGAGKSTTMRMITGFITPTSGTATVGGHDIQQDPIAAKRLFGYLPENAPAYTDMTVYGFLDFCAELRGLQGDARKKAVHRAVEMCFLTGVMHQSVDTLSKGYRHRTCFAVQLSRLCQERFAEIEIFRFKQCRCSFARGGSKDRRIEKSESSSVKEFPDRPDDLVPDAHNGVLARGPKPQMSAVR